ncbi:MAG: UDP-2,4-diacetamido-2,4,6-trideoxy-beta-L-altropyranose hydrolase [Pseudomonadota bacterium]
MAKNLVIRADAGPEIGTGHVMRCLALAQVWQDDGGDVTFLTATDVPALEERLQSEGTSVLRLTASPGSIDDALETADLAQKNNSAWVVADGYHFGSEYQRLIKNSGLKLLCVDDYGHSDHYYADIVLNQNISARRDRYPGREAYTELLLGTDYALLRREFLEMCSREREVPDTARKILISLGGSDSRNATLKAVRALKTIDLCCSEVLILVGSSNKNRDSLDKELSSALFRFSLLTASNDMPALVRWADMAISAGGSTCWELAYLGVPSIILVIADNQEPVAEGLDRAGAVLSLGRSHEISESRIAEEFKMLARDREKRREMARIGRKLVDGIGASRVLACMKETIALREASWADCELLFHWANDPDIRAASFRPDPISLEEHEQWLKSKLKAAGCFFYVAVDGAGVPIGQVRYDMTGGEMVISVSVDKAFRSKGYGSRIIRKGCEKVRGVTQVGSIHAYVKEGNTVSLSTFIKAGFEETALSSVQGRRARHFIMRT